MANVTIYRGPDGLYACADFIASSVPTGRDARTLQIAVAMMLEAAALGTRAFALSLRTETQTQSPPAGSPASLEA